MVRKFLFALLCLTTTTTTALSFIDDYMGPLKFNFSYSVVYLPSADPYVDCTRDVPFEEPVRARDYNYDTIHVTSSLTFHGKDTTDNLRWLSIRQRADGKPWVSTCWVGAGWALYVGTGNSTLREMLLSAAKMNTT